MSRRKMHPIGDVILEKLSKFVELKGQYEALVLEQYVVTEQVVASAATAWLEAMDLELVR